MMSHQIDLGSHGLTDVIPLGLLRRSPLQQSCNIFDDGAFASYRDKAQREDSLLQLEHRKPMVFGKDRGQGIRLNADDYRLEVVQLGHGLTEDDLLVHDEEAPPSRLMLPAEMAPPDFPMPAGVIRRIQRPTFDASVHEQIDEVTTQKGRGQVPGIASEPSDAERVP